MLLDSSLRREMARHFGASFTVLFSVVLTLLLIRILGQATEGLANPRDLFLLIGLACLSYLQFILGLALFIAVLTSFSRMHRDSEMVIWAGAGATPGQFFRTALRFSAPVLTVIALLTLVGWPWANRQDSALRQRFEQRSDLSRAAPGQFRRSASGMRVFFIGKGADAQGLAHDIFIRDLSDGRETVTVARSAALANRDDSRYLMLSDGHRYTHTLGQADYQITGFREMGVRVSALSSPATQALPGAATLANTPSREIDTPTLALSANPYWQGELSWRIGVPVSSLLLVLMAVPLAATNPRAGRALQLIVAVLVYLVYLNFLNATQHWIEAGTLHLGSGLLLLHGGALLVLLALAYAKDLLPRPLGPRAAA
ncbi:LPS export ABC transporter permease LptF [Thiomonas sp. FB-6]|uniref:LPS export ABC transporter permease LptF n=1 Tax=Thiomonas sp. FB-6 TaxID=1158291 RepID=UPI000373DDFC|nr:LPS export ABC transporter permease LptF [Thiomonas sp. FB-6]